MKLPRNFFKPLAIGAPAPMRELPLRLERMIHFVPPCFRCAAGTKWMIRSSRNGSSRMGAGAPITSG